MEIPNYPTNANEARAYAAYLSSQRGVDFVPIKLPEKNSFGIEFAAVEQFEVEAYTKAGATVIQ